MHNRTLRKKEKKLSVTVCIHSKYIKKPQEVLTLGIIISFNAKQCILTLPLLSSLSNDGFMTGRTAIALCMSRRTVTEYSTQVVNRKLGLKK